jgi:PAS domain S-box-containing protein
MEILKGMKEKDKIAKAAEESELKYRKIFDAAQEGILLFDASNGQIMDANSFLLNLLNYSLPELLTKKISDLGVSQEMMQVFVGAGGPSPAGSGGYKNVSFKTKEGRDLPLEMAGISYQLNDKSVVQCAIRNIAGRKLMETSIKKLAEELQIKTHELGIAREALKKLEELKSEFVSVVSHELRTPLATMLEFTSIISDEVAGKLTKEQKQYIGIIKDNIERLTRLITNLLDISNLEAGKIVLKKILFDPSHLVARLLSTVQAQADEKHIELKAKIPEGGINISADPERITQVFLNIIGNALRFTEESGRITVEIKETEKEVECSVIDTGIGISEEDLPKVFFKFQQFGRVPGSGEKGTGLGLSIAKNIVELHHGKIRVESKMGIGTKVAFALPKCTAEALFKEYVDNARLQLRKPGVKKSLVVVSLIHFDKLKPELPLGKPQTILKDIEGDLKNSLPGEVDLAVKDTGKVAMILVSYDEKDSFSIKGKLWQVLEDYLAREELSHKIVLRFGDQYPDETKSDWG